MTQRIKQLLSILKSKEYHAHRYAQKITLASQQEAFPLMTKEAVVLRTMLEAETPWFLPGDRMGFHRSNTRYYLEPQKDGTERFWGGLGNIIPDYETALNKGMEAIRTDIKARLALCSEDAREFYEAALLCIDAALSCADRWAAAAREAGLTELSRCLERVPRQMATTLLEACVFMQFLIYTLRCNRNVHMALGRFDKYMRPFYLRDLKAGLSRQAALETVEEFFICLNLDSDLYIGQQQGDNGQSLVLGGNNSFDDFSHLCMEAALELNLIDPKINLRVDRNTPDEQYEFATLMTKQGMGFPQYCNDDVVIPGLIKLGYAPEDAADYGVAACWEYIIPGKGMDVPNIRTLNYPKVVEKATREHLPDADTFDAFLQKVCEGIRAECDFLMNDTNRRVPRPSPYLSVFVQGCIERGKDLSQAGAIYNNYGFHGAGIATAADSLAAIKEVIFDTGDVSKEQLLAALAADFEGYGALRNRLLSCPKMGSADPKADTFAYILMDTFSRHLTGHTNNMGGIFRPGTGSAHEYHFSAIQVGATADGRKAYAPYGCSFSPSLEARPAGPLSCIRSFTGYDLTNVINGGPLTLELHHNVFRNEEGIQKTARLVKAFIALGGHQLQLNCINRETLLDALAHPEEHKNLIVRVWGWSGYFCELDPHFQQHILKRAEFSL